MNSFLSTIVLKTAYSVKTRFFILLTTSLAKQGWLSIFGRSSVVARLKNYRLEADSPAPYPHRNLQYGPVRSQSIQLFKHAGFVINIVQSGEPVVRFDPFGYQVKGFLIGRIKLFIDKGVVR